MQIKMKAKLWYRILKKFYITFWGFPIRKDLAERKGSCHQCGECCKSINCPLLELKIDGKYYCKLHDTPMMPYSCAISPIRIDFFAHKSGKNCGYYWDDLKKPVWKDET